MFLWSRHRWEGGEPTTLTTCRQAAGSSGTSGAATCPVTPRPAMALAASQGCWVTLALLGDSGMRVQQLPAWGRHRWAPPLGCASWCCHICAMLDSGTWHWPSLSHARQRRAVSGPSTPNPPRRAKPHCAVGRRAWGTCPLLPTEGRRGRRPPAQGPIPKPAAPCALGGGQLGLPRQAAGNGPGATGCGAAPAAAEQARPARQAAATPETGSQAVPAARDAGASTPLPWQEPVPPLG